MSRPRPRPKRRPRRNKSTKDNPWRSKWPLSPKVRERFALHYMYTMANSLFFFLTDRGQGVVCQFPLPELEEADGIYQVMARQCRRCRGFYEGDPIVQNGFCTEKIPCLLEGCEVTLSK